jgi:hypothetical protein
MEHKWFQKDSYNALKNKEKLLYLERYESFSQKGGQNNSYTHGTKDYF